MGRENQNRNGILLHNVTVRYGSRIALESITGEFAPGSLTAVVGPNGAGKTTLLAAITGSAPVAAGIIERPPPSRISYFPQRAALDLGFPVTVAELIALGAWLLHA